MIIVS